MCVILFVPVTGIHDYLIFCKLAHVAFCKQTLHTFHQKFLFSKVLFRQSSTSVDVKAVAMEGL